MLDTPVLCVSLVFGSLSLGAAIWVYVKHRYFGFGGSILSMAGIILLGMSVWKSIDIQMGKNISVRLQKAEQEIKKADQEIKKLNNFKTTLFAQAQFKELNLYKGPLDGTYNADFKNAITNFQKALKIPPTGIIDEKTSIALKDFPDQKAAASE
jgi:preprotein translocase subunit SecF